MACHVVRLVLVLAISSLIGGGIATAQDVKPLTNEDVIEMVKSGLQESTIAGAIQANATNFDVSAAALIRLKRAGVSQKIMDEMLSAESSRRTASAGNSLKVADTSIVAAPTQPTHVPTPAPGGASVFLMQGSARQEIPLEKTQLAQSKTKAASLATLSKDNVLNQGLQAGVSTVTMTGMMHSGSVVGSSAVGQAGIFVGGLLAHRANRQTVTYVWALPAPNSQTVANTHTPSFTVHITSIRGVNADEYEPAIVNLTSTPNNWRLVGATEGKQDAMSNPAFDWPVYSSFVEDRVPARSTKISSGNWQISLGSPLVPGEYGVVLRPLSKAKKFAGQDVGRNQADGLMFNSVWSFQVAPDAKP